MNKTKDEAFGFFDAFKKNNSVHEVVMCAPFVYIPFIPTFIKKGAQNCYLKDEGSFTGEISPKMLSTLGVEYVILGHSERRTHFGETNKDVNLKVLSALKNSLNVIICVEDFLQIKQCLLGVDKNKLNKVCFAYEPISSIGTGNASSSEKVEFVCAKIKEEVLKIYGSNAHLKIRTIYGGSVDHTNSREFIKQKSIDGVLVGRSSLDAKEFLQICESKMQ